MKVKIFHRYCVQIEKGIMRKRQTLHKTFAPVTDMFCCTSGTFKGDSQIPPLIGHYLI